MSVSKKYCTIVHFVLLIASVICYIYSPVRYSQTYCLSVSVIFILSAVFTSYLAIIDFKSLLSFDILFTFAFLYTNFLYADILYPTNPDFILFSLDFNYNYINKGLAMATIGYCSYSLGRTLNINRFINLKYSIKRLNTIPLFSFAIVFMIALIINILPNAGKEYYGANVFNVGFWNKISAYVYLVVYLLLIYAFMSCRGSFTKLIGGNVSFFICLILLLSLIVSVGSRTIPLRIGLLLLFLFNSFYHKLSNSSLFVFLIFGVFIMYLIGNVRSEGLEKISEYQFINIGKELIINNRSLYVLMDYSDKEGFTYGKLFLMNILSIVPFLQSFFLNMMGWTDGDISSANLVTDLYYVGTKYDITGLGTNLIGELYCSFGTGGVIALMFIMGYFINLLTESIKRDKMNVVTTILYGMMFCNSIYYTRSGYFTPLREIVWMLLLLAVFSKRIDTQYLSRIIFKYN